MGDQMKFCPECGTEFAASAKFCSNCGFSRAETSVPGIPEDASPLDWETFLKTYSPRRNQFAEINEAFGGLYFPSYGSVSSWLATQSPESIWTIDAAEDDLQPLSCKSGKWSGPGVVGYFLCEAEVPEDVDLSFTLPSGYVGFKEKIILTKDKTTKKWRPCAYLLKGDTTKKINLNALSEFESVDYDDPRWNLNRAQQSILVRSKNQLCLRFWPDEDEIAETAAQLDCRYFYTTLSDASGWTDFTTRFYQRLDEYLDEYPVEEMQDVWVLNSPAEADSDVFETQGRCAVCDDPNADDSGDEGDHVCQDGTLGGALFASFSPRSKSSYFEAFLPLEKPIADEDLFRSKTLSPLVKGIQSTSASGLNIAQRGESQMADEMSSLSLRRFGISPEKLVKYCNSCMQYNPSEAQVCFSCCEPFVDKIDGQLFVVINGDFPELLMDMKPADFIFRANTYYFVAQKSESPVTISPAPKVYGY